jgi:hypothetical protein
LDIKKNFNLFFFKPFLIPHNSAKDRVLNLL